MELDWVELRHFRSYAQLRLEPDQGVNVLVGPNGSGKSNFVEAVAYLATLRSLRGLPEEALVADTEQHAVVRGQVSRRDAASLIEVEVPRRGRRRVQVNRQRLARSAELLGHLRAVAFLPDDLDVVKRGPANRRAFLDQTAVQLWPLAHSEQQDFERALRQRNAFLRQAAGRPDGTTLEVWDARLSQAGAKLMERRARAAAAIRDEVERNYRRLAGDAVEVAMQYRSSWGGQLDPEVSIDERETVLRGALGAARRQDAERGTTTVGPHRDEPVYLLEGADTRTHASQGEQRTLALALRLGAHFAVEAVVGEAPLLLLDDVFSELDGARAEALGGALPAAQTFITTARERDVPVSGRVWKVAEGRVT